MKYSIFQDIFRPHVYVKTCNLFMLLEIKQCLILCSTCANIRVLAEFFVNLFETKKEFTSEK